MSDSVTLAYVHSNEVAHSFHRSVMDLLLFDAGNAARIGGFIALRCGTNGLVRARNMVVEGFLAAPTDWLFIVDTDMGFAADTVERLLQAADADGRPIVGALCFGSRETAEDGMSGYRTSPRPTVLDWVELPAGGHKTMARTTYPINTVVQCAATGAACILIHRSVFEKISTLAVENGKKANSWYDRLPGTDGSLLGEDVSFCLRAGAAGIPLFVHTGVKTTHLKPQWVGEHDFWTAVGAPPATQETAVVVPVVGRPGNAEPFMRSLRASTGLATVYAVCEPEDEDSQKAWAAAGARLIWSAGGDLDHVARTFAEKCNLGYQLSDEPWLFFVGDDVRFRPGWLDHAQHIGETLGASVVGTNDLGNPRVQAGEHATHLLIRRTYIDEQGASWDGPGVVAHEGYRHWFVDDEIVTVAKKRGVWQMALGSVVEHLHPLFGKGEQDEVYRLGQSHADADRATFQKRVRKHLRVAHA